MSKSFWQPFKSVKKKQERDKKISEKVGKFVDSETESDRKEVPLKKNDNPSKNAGSCRSLKWSSFLTCSPKVQIKSSHGKSEAVNKRTTGVIKNHILQKQMSCPEQEKQESSRTLQIPKIKRLHSYDETKNDVTEARSENQNREHVITNTGDTGNCHCEIDFPNDQNINVSCKIVPKSTRPTIDTYGNIVSEELNNNGDANCTRSLQLEIDNIRNIPPSGKIVVSVELPTSSLQHVQFGPSTSTIVEVRTHSPMGNNIWITENINVTEIRRPSLENLRLSPPMDYLKVDEGFRPRSNSDSKLNNNRPTQGSKDKNLNLLPGIMVEDFSVRKAELRKELEGQSKDLRLDLCDDDEFFSLLQGRRRRSFTCPENALSRPNSAELLRE